MSGQYKQVMKYVMKTKYSPWSKDVKKFVIMSKRVSWHQVVCHVIKNFHNVKTFTMTSNMLDMLCLLLRYKFVMMLYICHDLKKSVCPDFKMFVIMSKYVMRTNGSSLLQKARHYVNMTSSRQNVCHRIKRFVRTSTIRQMFVIKSKNMSWCQKVCHDRSYIQI